METCFTLAPPVGSDGPTLQWSGKRLLQTAAYCPARCIERYGGGGGADRLFLGDNHAVLRHLLRDYRGVTPQLLREKGIRLLLCDLDYTLAPKSVKVPNDGVKLWIDTLKAAGITVMILSNNRSGKRVNDFCRALGIDYEGHAQKPLPRGLRRAMSRAGVTPAETAMLGDKLLTDVLAANLSGVTALMVEPVGGAVTLWQKVLHALQAPFKAMAREKEELS